MNSEVHLIYIDMLKYNCKIDGSLALDEYHARTTAFIFKATVDGGLETMITYYLKE